MKAGNVLYRVVNARYRAYRPQTLKTSKCNFKYDDAHHDAHATGTGAGAGAGTGTGTGRLSKNRIKQQRKFVHPQPNELSLDRCRTRERTFSAFQITVDRPLTRPDRRDLSDARYDVKNTTLSAWNRRFERRKRPEQLWGGQFDHGGDDAHGSSARTMQYRPQKQQNPSKIHRKSAAEGILDFGCQTYRRN